MSSSSDKHLLGFSDLMSLGIGQIIGSGIMVFTGMVIGMTGYGITWAFLAAALVAILKLVPGAVQASAMPVRGGNYVYIKNFIGPKIAFFQLCTTVLSGMIVSTMAVSFAQYFQGLFPGASVRLVAFAVLTLAFVLNIIGIKTAAKAQKVMVGMLLLALLLFIAFGMPQVKDISYLTDVKRCIPNGTGNFFAGVTMLSFACQGAGFLMENGDRVKDPGKTLPKAMIVSTVLVAVLYIFVSIVAVGVLPLEQTAGKSLLNTAAAIFPQPVYIFFIVGGAMCALLTTLNGDFSWMPMGLYACAKQGWLPKVFTKTNKAGTPWLLLSFFYGINAIVVLLDVDTTFISTMTTGVTMIGGVIPAISCLMFAIKHADIYEKAQIKMPKGLYIFITCLYIVISVYLSSRNFSKLTPTALVCMAVFLVVCAVYSIFREKKLTAMTVEAAQAEQSK